MTKIPAHVMEFAQGNVDIYKAFAEYFPTEKIFHRPLR